MSRFDDLKAKLAAKGATDPAGLARYIGDKKYGKAGMAALQAAGRAKRAAKKERSALMVETERRYTLVPVELRQRDDRRKIGGYAAVFGRESRNLGGFVEVVDPIAFNKSRGDGWPDVICRYNHDDNMLLGTSAARTLTLSIDGYGLGYEVDPPQSRADILELVERGDVNKSSFAFRAFDDDWALTDQGYPKRSVLGAQLIDVAPVNIPAYSDTSAGLRSLARKMEASEEEVRKFAREDELRRFFVRTDRPSSGPPAKRTFGPAARMAILGKKQGPTTPTKRSS